MIPLLVDASMKTVSDHRTILQELDQLVQDTFSLWREGWVGFSMT
jgi:hypothetical protein